MLLLTAAGCAGGQERESARTPPSTTDAVPPSPGPGPGPGQAANPPSEAAVTDIGIRITLGETTGGTTVTGTLRPSAAASSLLAQLPHDFAFRDFGGQEKLAKIPRPLSLDGMPAGSAAEPGTIGYYVPDQVLVLYYEHVGYYPGIIPLGTFDDIPTIQHQPDGFSALIAAAE